MITNILNRVIGRTFTFAAFNMLVELLLIAMLAGRGFSSCDANVGPAGQAECILGTPYYFQYQCGTCLSNAYIVQKSAGKAHCRDPSATYCYYQCMLESYDLDSGPVYDDCSCDAGQPIPQPSVILPADCYSPDGSDCTWYSRCLATRFPCTGQTDYVRYSVRAEVL